MDEIKIQINYSVESDFGPYVDSLYYSPEEYAQLAPEDIQAEKDKRFANWIEIMNTPAPAIQLTQEQIAQYLEQERLRLAEIEKLIDGNKV